MARTGRPITEPEKLKKEKFSRDWDVVHRAVKKESSARVSQMLRWKKWQEAFDPEGMCDMYEDEGIFDQIEEARKINTNRLHDRTRYWTEARNKIDALESSIEIMQANIVVTLGKLPTIEDQTEIDRLNAAIANAHERIDEWQEELPALEEKLDKVESDQWECARQITKIFCKVHEQILELGGGNPDALEAGDEPDAFEEYEYEIKDY